MRMTELMNEPSMKALRDEEDIATAMTAKNLAITKLVQMIIYILIDLNYSRNPVFALIEGSFEGRVGPRV